jgi:hypothetical protein
VFGAAAFVHAARAMPGAGHLLEFLERSLGREHIGTVAASYWFAWVIGRRGEHERAWIVIKDADAAGNKSMQPFRDQVVADLLAVSRRWDDVPAFMRESRAYAAEAELVALPVHLDRLEARSKVDGDLDTGSRLLKHARAGFDDLGATWERARTELDLAEALLGAGRTQDARSMADAAAPDLERVGALLELDRLRALRARVE